jgi:hypothetical protein
MVTTTTRQALRQCLASSAEWRREAAILREHAAMQHLRPGAKEQLLCEAQAADRQADWWLNGAIDLQQSSSESRY